MSVDVDQERGAVWRRCVEAAVEHLADDYEVDPAELLAQEAFIARLDGTVGLDPDVDAEQFAEAVEVALAEHTWETCQMEPGSPAVGGSGGPPAGGQFAAGGGRVGAKAKPAKSGRGAGHGRPGKPAGPLGFDGKSGTGYDSRGGDPQVKQLQAALTALGFRDAQGQPLKVDGKFGPRTQAAVRAMQQKYGGIGSDGKVTPELLARLKSAAAKVPKSKTPAKPPARARESVHAEIQRADRIEGRVLEAVGTDEAGGRVFRVRIIREGTSKNRKRYTESVLRNASHLYEGAKAFDHHRTPAEMASSTLQGLCGGYRDVSYAGDGLYGNLHLLPSAAHVAEALDASIAAQQQGLPPLVGISHDVLASFKAGPRGPAGHVQEAVAITRVHSADVVADPSAGGQVTRVLAGGIETEEEEPVVTITTPGLLDALQTASAEELAAVREALLPAETIEPEPERVTEAGDPKDSIAVKVFVRQKLTDAGMGALYATIVDRLPERVTEAHVDAEIAAYKAMLGDVERAGLRPTVTSEVVKESRDKQVERLDKFFASDFVGGYHSLRHAYMDITGYRPNFEYTEDVNRRILRESFGAGFDSGARTTESVDTSTWAQVLGDSVTRRVVAAYRTPSLQSWRRVVSSIVPVEDFRTQRVGRVGGYGTLPTVLEGGPYQPLASPPDEEATYALSKKGGTEDVTLEQIANDDRRVIPKIPGKLGRAAAQTLYRFVFDFFTSNATATYDSVAWFHSSHGNTAAASLSQSAVSAASVALMTQTAYGDSSEVLGEPASLLVVPAALREIAFQICRSAVAVPSTAAGPSDTPNIHSQQDNLDFVVVPYFSDANDWFALADPQAVPTLEVGFYQGRQEPEIFTQADNSVGSVFNADVFTWKVRFIFSGTILDHRGVYRGTQ